MQVCSYHLYVICDRYVVTVVLSWVTGMLLLFVCHEWQVRCYSRGTVEWQDASKHSVTGTTHGYKIISLHLKPPDSLSECVTASLYLGQVLRHRPWESRQQVGRNYNYYPDWYPCCAANFPSVNPADSSWELGERFWESRYRHHPRKISLYEEMKLSYSSANKNYGLPLFTVFIDRSCLKLSTPISLVSSRYKF